LDEQKVAKEKRVHYEEQIAKNQLKFRTRESDL
jgi:hypothetical protein